METQIYSTGQNSRLKELFLSELKEIYCGEHNLIRAWPGLIRDSSSIELALILKDHLKETEAQIKKLELVFINLNLSVESKQCEAIKGLISEAEVTISATQKGSMRDAGIISTAQKIKHFEIAAYGILRTFASTLGLTEAASIFHEILGEEKSMDERLTSLAESSINFLAASEK